MVGREPLVEDAQYLDSPVADDYSARGFLAAVAGIAFHIYREQRGRHSARVALLEATADAGGWALPGPRNAAGH